jgi:predicted kinase
VHINPDHYLETSAGRITTPERNAEAWTKCFAALDEALAASAIDTKVYVLVGPQGSGKSTWAEQRRAQEPDAIIFDAILVKRSERHPILERVRQHQRQAVAVWFRTSLDVCLARNAARPSDQVAAEQGIRNVYRAVEPPSESEGFAGVVEIA